MFQTVRMLITSLSSMGTGTTPCFLLKYLMRTYRYSHYIKSCFASKGSMQKNLVKKTDT